MSILDSATVSYIQWAGDTIQVIELRPGTALYRVYRHPGMDWDAPPPEFRLGRLDPPATNRHRFGTLYTAESPLTAAFEARAVRMVVPPGSSIERLEIASDDDQALPPRRVVRHTVSIPICFLNFEHRESAKVFGLDPDAVLDRISMWQAAMHRFVDRLEQNTAGSQVPLVGVAHQSKLRGSNGWNFGFVVPRHQDVLERGESEMLHVAQYIPK